MPEFRNKSLGNELLTNAINDMIKINKRLKYIGLNCNKNNLNAQNMYTKNRFEKYDFNVINHYLSHDNNEIFMYKKIKMTCYQKFMSCFW